MEHLRTTLEKFHAKLCGNQPKCTIAVKLATIYSIVLSIYTGLRHHFFMTRAYDLGIFIQALWTTIHSGKFFYETPDMGISHTGSFFGVHFAPIMFLILAIYYVFPSPYTLLTFQSFLLGFAAIPLFKLANHILKDENKALIISATYLIYPPIIATNLFDFHLEAFFPIIIFSALYYLEREDFPKFYLLVLLNLIILDLASLVMSVALIIYGSFLKYWREIINFREMSKKLKIHVFVITFALLIIAAVYYKLTLMIIQQLGATPFSKTQNWSKLGSNLYEMIEGLFNPTKVYESLAYDWSKKIWWLILILMPVIFLPLFAPISFMPGFTILAVFLLSTYHAYYELGWQYGAMYAPLIFYAATKGLNNLKKLGTGKINILTKEASIPRKIITILEKIDNKKLLATLVILSLASPIPGFTAAKNIDIYNGTAFVDQIPIPNQHTETLRKILNLVPENASVLAQNNIFPHFANREDAYIWLPLKAGAVVDYVIGDVTHSEYFMLIPGKNFTYNDVVNMLIDTGEYGVYASADGIFLLKKGYSGHPVIFKPLEKMYNYENLIPINGEKTVINGSKERKVIYIRGKPNQTLWSEPILALTPGTYTLAIRLLVKNHTRINTTLLTFGLKNYIVQGENYSKTINITTDQLNTWMNISMTIQIKHPSLFKIFGKSLQEIDYYIDYIEINQTDANTPNHKL
ncbi:MAG: DUF2079 domain-containing protein [Candidatus Njordarchaeia archaeon]